MDELFVLEVGFVGFCFFWYFLSMFRLFYIVMDLEYLLKRFLLKLYYLVNIIYFIVNSRKLKYFIVKYVFLFYYLCVYLLSSQ